MSVLITKEGDGGMSINEKQEKLYLPTDDTVDIGKEPLPITDPEIARVMKENIERFKKSQNQKHP